MSLTQVPGSCLLPWLADTKQEMTGTEVTYLYSSLD